MGVGIRREMLAAQVQRLRLARVAAALSLQRLVVAAGFLAGLLAGHLYHQHNQVVLIERLYTGGGVALRSEPVRTSYGYRMVLHDFSPLAYAGPGRADAQHPADAAAAAAAAAAAGAADATTAAAAAAGAAAAAAPAPPPAGPRFHRGTGARSSYMYSLSNATGLTAADKRRIAAALQKRASELPGDSIHALMTGNGSPYQNIQGRIMLASMNLIRRMPGGDKIKAFTRIMHRTADDDLVEEFSTFRAYPLQPSCDTWCEFPVKDRANAVVQWLMAAEHNPDLVQGAWLLLLESDYVWMKPLELPGSAHDLAVQGLGFTYDYIDPQYPSAAKVLREMCPECDVAQVPHSGPSPVLLRPAELALVAPDWEEYSAWIEGNDHARDVLGWVREMYAWCVAVHKNGVQLVHQAPPKSRLMAQPPHDFVQGEAAILHYTWGSLFHKGGKEFWRFDKRDYTAKELELKVPEFKLPPQPWEEGWTLQDGLKVTKELHALLTAMLQQMNSASATLPALTPAQQQR